MSLDKNIPSDMIGAQMVSEHQLSDIIKDARVAVDMLLNKGSTYIDIKNGLIRCEYNINAPEVAAGIFSKDQKTQNIQKTREKIKKLSAEERFIFAFEGAGIAGSAAGVARSLSEYNIIEPEERFRILRLTAYFAPEETLKVLARIPLPSASHVLTVALIASQHTQKLNYNDYCLKRFRMEADGENREKKSTWQETQRQKNEHVRSHPLYWMTFDSFETAENVFLVLRNFFHRDPFGTGLYFGSNSSSCADWLGKMTIPQRFELLHELAHHGLGLASQFLPIFSIPPSEENIQSLKEIFFEDITSGYSIFGALALEYIHQYPFGVESFSIDMPRRVTEADARTYINAQQKKPEKLSEADMILEKEREKDRVEIPRGSKILTETLNYLEQRETNKFLESLNMYIQLEWKGIFSETKRNLVFVENKLIIRQVLFLLAHAFLEDDESVQKNIDRLAGMYIPDMRKRIHKLDISSGFTEAGMTITEGFSAFLFPILEEKKFHVSKSQFLRFLKELVDFSQTDYKNNKTKLDAIFERYLFVPSHETKTLQQVYELANRRYFIDKLGLDSSFLADVTKSPTQRPILDELKPVTLGYFLNSAMSLYLRGGSLEYLMVHWKMLFGSYKSAADTKDISASAVFDSVFSHTASLFQAIDLLLTILNVYVEDGITRKDISATLSYIRWDIPIFGYDVSKKIITPPADVAPLKTISIMSRDNIDSMREASLRFCVQILRHIGKSTDTSIITLIQKLPIPSSLQEKLLSAKDRHR